MENNKTSMLNQLHFSIFQKIILLFKLFNFNSRWCQFVKPFFTSFYTFWTANHSIELLIISIYNPLMFQKQIINRYDLQSTKYKLQFCFLFALGCKGVQMNFYSLQITFSTYKFFHVILTFQYIIESTQIRCNLSKI